MDDVDHEEAVSLGLLKQDEVPAPSVPDFNQSLQASVKGLGFEMLDILQTHFGPQITLAGDSVSWNSILIRADMKSTAPESKSPPEPGTPSWEATLAFSDPETGEPLNSSGFERICWPRGRGSRRRLRRTQAALPRKPRRTRRAASPHPLRRAPAGSA